MIFNIPLIATINCNSYDEALSIAATFLVNQENQQPQIAALFIPSHLNGFDSNIPSSDNRQACLENIDKETIRKSNDFLKKLLDNIDDDLRGSPA